MQTTKYLYVEKLLRRYPHIDDLIKQRRSEILAPWSPQDENIGGGKSNVMANTAERTVIKLVDDPTIVSLEHQRDTIARHLADADEDTVAIVTACYFAGHRGKSVQSIAQQLMLSDRTAYRKRESFLDELSQEFELTMQYA